MRNAFADEINRQAQLNERVVLLSGDIGNKLFDRFKEANDGRYFNCGIAEANMMGVAAGMALSGLRPVIYTIAPFTTTRCLEQIRVDVCYQNVPVIIVGTGAGLSYAELGATHHSCEDIALLRVLPGMTVLAPCETRDLRALLRAALQQTGPVYMRIGKKGEANIYPEKMPLIEIGKAARIREGSDVCVIGTGTIMVEVVRAGQLLEQQGIAARIECFHTVKPLDTECLKDAFSRYPLVAVVEEHSRIGGLASSIAEWRVTQRGNLAEMQGFGVADEFLHEVGSQSYARKHFGLTAENIASQIRQSL